MKNAMKFVERWKYWHGVNSPRRRRYPGILDDSPGAPPIWDRSASTRLGDQEHYYPVGVLLAAMMRLNAPGLNNGRMTCQIY